MPCTAHAGEPAARRRPWPRPECGTFDGGRDVLKEWLTGVTEQTIVIIDAIALVVIVYGTIEVVIRIVRASLRSAPNHEKRDIWLAYARWLIAALTFQLASDIIESSISTSWEAIARLAAIAVIRTFLEFFLGRDVTEIRERQRSAPERAA